MELFKDTSKSDMQQGREFLLLDREQVVSIIENMADAVIVLSPDAAIWYANKALLSMIDWQLSDLIGVPFGKIVVNDEVSLFAMLQQMIAKGPIRDYETCLKSRKGERIPVSFNGSVLRDENGKLLGIVGVARDNRETKRLILKLEEANINLERKVMQRTAELENAYNDLKKKEAQLFQSEKMVSLGQLSAGVAHEINNPIGFISSNLRTLERYVETFIGLANLYSEMERDAGRLTPEGIRSAVERGRAYKETHDMDFIIEDVLKVIKESDEGAERVRKIVMDLKEFSHQDTVEKSCFNINRGLDSTLNIVRNEIKYRAEVIKEYTELPEILCYPQELNQVFMNLLINASHAVTKNGRITIRTYADQEHVYVEISDNGCGIPDDVIPKIFEPFFTTKEVGKGTGLGLSISYGIVKRHNGNITVKSKVGEGTSFTVSIPIGNDR